MASLNRLQGFPAGGADIGNPKMTIHEGFGHIDPCMPHVLRSVSDFRQPYLLSNLSASSSDHSHSIPACSSSRTASLCRRR